MLHYFDSHQKKQNKDYFLHLLNVAKVDGKITKEEADLLYKIGRRLNLTDQEIHFLLASDEDVNYQPPTNLEEKFSQFYTILKLTLADGVFTEDEKRMSRIYATAAGFSEKEIVLLLEIIYQGLKNNRDEDELFEEFKRRRMKV